MDTAASTDSAGSRPGTPSPSVVSSILLQDGDAGLVERAGISTPLLMPLVSTSSKAKQRPHSGAHRAAHAPRQVSLTRQMVVMAVAVVLSVVSNVSQKVAISIFQTRYSFFAEQVMNIAYVPLGFATVAALKLAGSIRRSETQFPQIYFIGLAVFDSIGTVLAGIGNQYTPGNVQAILSQLVILVSMAASRLVLGTRYGGAAYLGALLVVMASAVSVMRGDGGDGGAGGFRLYACVIYASSYVFFGLSFVLKEWTFKRAAARTGSVADPYYLTTWVAFWMVPISFVVYPIQALPGFGGLALDQLLPVLRDGALCAAGEDTLATDTCGGALLPLIVFSLATFLSGVAAVVLTRDCSAVVQFVASGLAVPLTQLTYSVPLMGRFHEAFTSWDGLALVLVSTGSIVYVFGDPTVRLPRLPWGKCEPKTTSRWWRPTAGDMEGYAAAAHESVAARPGSVRAIEGLTVEIGADARTGNASRSGRQSPLQSEALP